MKVLITGSGGQVGLELIRTLVAKGHEVVATDVRPRPDGAHASAAWELLDVTDLAAVEAAFGAGVEVVYHLAAILSATGEQIPHTCYEVNQTGTWHVLEAARRTGVRQVVFASTIAAFGPGLPDPVPNEVSMRPTTMYGLTKVAGELLGEYFRDKWGLDFRGVRFPGLINAGLPGGGTSDYALFMYVDGVRKGRYESFCTEETRIQLMYMPDAIGALVGLSEAPREPLQRSIYNIQGFSPTALEIAASVRRALPEVDLTFAPDPARQAILDSWPNALDATCAREEWGFTPEYDLEGMTAHLIPEVRRMLDEGLIPAL